jgi:hypothetical protein
MADRAARSATRSMALLLTASLLAPGCATVAGVAFTAAPDTAWETVEKDRTECEAIVSPLSTSVPEGTKAGVGSALWLGFEGAVSGAAFGAIQGGGDGVANGSWIGAAPGAWGVGDDCPRCQHQNPRIISSVRTAERLCGVPRGLSSQHCRTRPCRIV